MAKGKWQMFRAICLLPFAICHSVCRLSWAGQTCSGEAKHMVAKAAECLERQDVGCAKLKLDPLLAREPGCADALFVKGWIVQYIDQKPQEGQAMQDRAIELDPKLSEFWEQRGHAIEAKLTSQEFSHFDLQFYGAEDRGKAWDAVKYLNGMYNELGSLFGVFPKNRIPIIVFTTAEFLEAWRAPFIGGFFDKRDGKVRIRVDEMPGGDAEFRHRARHEFTHAFMHQIYPHDLPAWISEGMAEYYARSNSGVFWKEERLEQIRKICKNGGWLSLAEIQEAISKKRVSALKIQLAYLQSEALVIYVSKERGDSWIPNVMNHLRERGGTFEAAFLAVLGVTPESVFERLRHSWE